MVAVVAASPQAAAGPDAREQGQQGSGVGEAGEQQAQRQPDEGLRLVQPLRLEPAFGRKDDQIGAPIAGSHHPDDGACDKQQAARQPEQGGLGKRERADRGQQIADW